MNITQNPIPDHIRPIVAIGTVLPPFALVILAYLWFKLQSDTAVILPYLAYCSLTLLPLALSLFAGYRFKGTALPGRGPVPAAVFWILALIPLASTMSTLNNIDVQLALALPVVLIAGFYVSTVIYLVSAMVCATFITKNPPSSPNNDLVASTAGSP
jgi:hypothetical protein